MFLWTQLADSSSSESENRGASIIIKDERLYRHAYARFNFTTYDLQRDQDVVQWSGSKRGMLIYSPNADGPHPWCYAIVLGIFHLEAALPNKPPARVEFLWVRWLDIDPSWIAGPSTCNLERVCFAVGDPEDCFGFIDPKCVIRGCHLIPAFAHGRTEEYLEPSLAREPEGDWKYYYVTR